MEPILQDEVIAPTEGTSIDTMCKRGSGETQGNHPLSVLRDALLFQLNSEEEMDQDIQTSKEDISHAKSTRPEGVLDRGEEHY